MERVRPCLHEENELCYNFINIVTWAMKTSVQVFGCKFPHWMLLPSIFRRDQSSRCFSPVGSPVEPGSRGGQRELCGPAKEPRNPPELSSSAGQWKSVDPGSAEPFRCYACKAATMYSSLAFQSLKFYECKAWRTEVLNWLRSQLS